MNHFIQDRLKEKVLILDGSTGTMLQQQGMPAGVAPERFCLDQPEVLQRVQQDYLEAGSDIIYSATFGANRIKLKNFGLEQETYEINRRLAELSGEVAHRQGKWVAGSIGPTGVFFNPFGEVSVDEGVAVFKEQIQGLVAGGVDLLVIETQIDIQEARLALLAAKECCDLPVMVSMTFDEKGRTLTGSDPLTCLNILQSLGASVFGINCSTGPEHMLEVVKTLREEAAIPLMVKPNAGLPVIVKGETVFPMAATDYCVFSKPFYDAGVSLMGGCCGTTPEYIRQVAEELKGLVPKVSAHVGKRLLLSSARQTITVSGRDPIRVIGERINPTGKAIFQEELKAGKLDQLKQFAQDQQAMGAAVLDVNVGMPGLDEKAMMLKAVAELAVMSELPLCIDSSNPEVLEAALRFYPGRVLLNSLSGEQEKLEHVLPLIKKYGPAFITLPLDDHGIPETAAKRIEVLKTVKAYCEKAEVLFQDVVVDGLVLTASSSQQAARTTLETMAYAAGTLGLNTVVGLSNVSFGLPGRAYLNSSFLAMAAAHGLSMVIANPSAPLLMEAVASSNVLTGRDPESRLFIERFSNPQHETTPKTASRNLSAEERVQAGIVQGDRDNIVALVEAMLEKGWSAFEIVDRLMIPAIQEVGDKYNNRVFFLPQLIASAETMEKAMAFLAPWLEKSERAKKGLGIIATVKGDIHDIGKKIVALMLRNQGYEILDLGKSVEEQTIIDKALETKADFIGLSALMTTTMTEMPKIIQLAKAQGVKAKIIVGGAVVTARYAEEIGANAYALDAGQAVTVVEEMLSHR